MPFYDYEEHPILQQLRAFIIQLTSHKEVGTLRPNVAESAKVESKKILGLDALPKELLEAYNEQKKNVTDRIATLQKILVFVEKNSHWKPELLFVKRKLQIDLACLFLLQMYEEVDAKSEPLITYYRLLPDMTRLEALVQKIYHFHPPTPISLILNIRNTIYKAREYFYQKKQKTEAVHLLSESIDSIDESNLYFPAARFQVGAVYLERAIFTVSFSDFHRALYLFHPSDARICAAYWKFGRCEFAEKTMSDEFLDTATSLIQNALADPLCEVEVDNLQEWEKEILHTVSQVVWNFFCRSNIMADVPLDQLRKSYGVKENTGVAAIIDRLDRLYLLSISKSSLPFHSNDEISVWDCDEDDREEVDF